MKRNKGQSTLEYAVVIAVVIAALVFMGWGWFRGAYQKRIMSAGDDISGGGQFDILHTTVTSTSNSNSQSSDNMVGRSLGASFDSSQNQQASSNVSANTSALSERRSGAD
jgi:hypothetical protein